jgi:Bacterial Ig-like domain (group 3)
MATATTNSLGVATAPAFSANTSVGSYVVNATVSDLSTSFNLSNTAGAASSVVATAGTPQTAVVGTAFGTAMQVTVDDQFGNPVGGVIVTFTAPTGGAGGGFGSSRTTTATTNSLGVARAPTFTANTSAGTYTVSATVPNTASTATFSLTNTAGTATGITATAGSDQSTLVGTTFGKAMKAAVVDRYGNPVAGVIVTFAAPDYVGPSIGPSGGFSGAYTTTATTNSLGVATAPDFTANNYAGTYGVNATIPSIAPVNFGFTNVAKTSTTLSVQPIMYLGHPWTLTATVSAVAPAVSHPMGSASFFDESKLLGSATINSSGQAVFTSNLSLGVHSITATYAGDFADLTSGSSAVPIRVGGTVTGDFDGDGKSDIAIYDQTSATFYIQDSGNGALRVQPFGNPSDKNIAVMGDFLVA